jgi:crotonobetainyl-CoA hydratase
MGDPVRLAVRDNVLEVTLDRPKANAIDTLTSRRLGEVFADYARDDTLRCAIVTGGGERIFSAGWDLKAAAEKGEGEYEFTDYGVGGFAGLTEMFDLDKPVIAAVNGLAIGGGFELALACDLIVAADHVEFAMPETSVGVVADAGGVQRLPKRIPYHIAMELFLTGRRMPVQEAARYGLVNAVVPLAQLMDTARAMAQKIVDGAPLSVRAFKQVIRGIEGMSVQEAYQEMRAGAFPTYTKMLSSEDAREGPRAFAEKRKPVWKGR